MMRKISFMVLFIMTLANSVFAQGNNSDFNENWPQFRGPASNQLPGNYNLPVEWNTNKNILWKHEIPGSGWSSPIIWEDKIFISTAVSDNPSVEQRNLTSKESPDEDENRISAVYSYELHCLDLNSGRLLWKSVAHKGLPSTPTNRDNTYASETPVSDGKHIYVYYGMTGLYCFDFEGNLVWEKNLGAYKMRSNWGTSTSPLLYNNILYMQIDNDENSFLAALDADTGEEHWRIPRDKVSSWSTPIIWKNKIRTELVTIAGPMRSYDPETGKVLWELEMGGGRSSCSPVSNDEFLYAGNEDWQGGNILFAVKAGASGDITPREGESSSDGVAWSQPDAGLTMPSPLLYKGNIYLVNRRNGFVSCYDAVTGKPHYQRTRTPEAKAFWATPWAYEDKLFSTDEAGTTYVFQTGNEYKLLYENPLEDKIMASAAFSEGTIILRGVKYVYCIRNQI
ncbi:PQQ-binding-like beta-propeller repeat protein [Candidatus Latescibacterota bacterium]